MVLSIIIVALISLVPSSAELIKYRDEEGNLHVVDSPEAVPEKYRQKTETMRRGVTAVVTPCDGKEMCAVIYMMSDSIVGNPSDLVLRMSKSFLRLAPKNPKHGGMVMVGSGSVAENEEAAKMIGKGAVPDYQDRISREFKSATTPFYFVQNKNKEVVLFGDKAKAWIDTSFEGSD